MIPQPKFWLGQTVKVIRPDDDEDYYDYYEDYGSGGVIGSNYVVESIIHHTSGDYDDEPHYYSYCLENSNWHREEVLVLEDSCTPHMRIPFGRPIKAKEMSVPIMVRECSIERTGAPEVLIRGRAIKFSDLLFNTTPIL